MSLCVTARFYVVGHLSLVIPLPPPSISSCESTTGRKTSEKTSFGSITESLLASSNHRLVSDPTSQYTSGVSPPPISPSPHLSPLGHFMPNCSQGKRGEGRRGDRRRKIFSPTLLPPSAADYRGKLFMCALSSSSSSSSLRSQAATKTNPPKGKQVSTHPPLPLFWLVCVGDPMLPLPKVLLVSCDGSQGRRVHHYYFCCT